MNENKRVLIPNIFTCLNIIGGISALFWILLGHTSIAAWLIIAAILFDALDGKIARSLNQESEFGFQMDSLADMVTSGIAPAALAFQASYTSSKTLAMSFSILYALAVGYRLARFNVLHRKTGVRGYLGLPAPIAGFTLAGYWLSNYRIDTFFPQLWWILLLLFSILMVTEIHYDWPRLDFSTPANRVVSLLKLAATGAMIIFPGWCIFSFFIIYILRGLFLYCWSILRKVE